MVKFLHHFTDKYVDALFCHIITRRSHLELLKKCLKLKFGKLGDLSWDISFDISQF